MHLFASNVINCPGFLELDRLGLCADMFVSFTYDVFQFRCETDLIIIIWCLLFGGVALGVKTGIDLESVHGRALLNAASSPCLGCAVIIRTGGFLF